MAQLVVTVNGAERASDVEPRTLLVDYVRDELGLTGTKVACDTSQCGACTVLLDGRAVKSCTVLALQADGGYKLEKSYGGIKEPVSVVVDGRGRTFAGAIQRSSPTFRPTSPSVS